MHRKLPFFVKICNFFKFLEYYWILLKKIEKTFSKSLKIRNLNFVTSELDSESLSTLRKIIFKRDSCKVKEVAASVITSCKKVLSVNFKQFHKISQIFTNFHTMSQNFTQFHKISQNFKKSIYLLSAFRPLALGGGHGPIPPEPPAITSPGLVMTLIFLTWRLFF